MRVMVMGIVALMMFIEMILRRGQKGEADLTHDHADNRQDDE
jgi:hypothetical protein